MKQVQDKMKIKLQDEESYKPEELLHYYSFSFIGFEKESGDTLYTSIYVGYKDKHITVKRIEAAKINSDNTENAVLLSCCYLGKMTNDIIINQE